LVARGSGIDDSTPQHEAALERLTSRYWPAIYAHLRRKGESPEAAAELTQAFFTDVVLGRKLFAQAGSERGKLRTLLLTALQNYRIDRFRRERTRIDARCLSLDGFDREEGFLAADPEADAAAAFERRWAVAMLDEAMARCRAYLDSIDKPGHWRLFVDYVIRPARDGDQSPSMSELATRHGFASPVHAASALKVVRKRLRILLREVAAETAATPHDRDEEYQLLLQQLSQA
jgi:DNA-directed RNA polymerase specialized sigma24 family protein